MCANPLAKFSKDTLKALAIWKKKKQENKIKSFHADTKLQCRERIAKVFRFFLLCHSPTSLLVFALHEIAVVLKSLIAISFASSIRDPFLPKFPEPRQSNGSWLVANEMAKGQVS